jgi:hypothetical protein
MLQEDGAVVAEVREERREAEEAKAGYLRTLRPKMTQNARKWTQNPKGVAAEVMGSEDVAVEVIPVEAEVEAILAARMRHLGAIIVAK